MKPLAILLVCIAVLVYRRPRPVRVPARWVEDDDGVQPVDPYTLGCPEHGCRLLRWHGGPHWVAA